ncbi:MAG: Zn-ribbon domain-containing OB-fold protein [Brevefilum sp.]|nr:Zn-ribbon domain-containing OB-fold protein [Brevefilum sp.]
MAEFSMNSKDFFTALETDQLIGSHCLDCGAMVVPQRGICPRCLGSNTEIVSLSGKGTLLAFTVIYVPSLMMAQAGYDAKNPYCVGVVKLDEGPKISGQILDVDVSQPESIQIGTKLIMTTIKRGGEENEKTYLGFRPV